MATFARNQLAVFETATGEAYQVQGRAATSYEYNAAYALGKVGIPYLFQFQFFGGRRVRGGLVVDFLVLTRPLSTPLYINGNFWHSGQQAAEDKYQQVLLFAAARGELNRAVEWFDPDCATKEQALAAARRDFLR